MLPGKYQSVRNGVLCVVAGTTSIEHPYTLRYAESIPIDAPECTQSVLLSLRNRCAEDRNCVQSFVSLVLCCEASTFCRRHILWRCLFTMLVATWDLLAPVQSRLQKCPMVSRTSCVEEFAVSSPALRRDYVAPLCVNGFLLPLSPRSRGLLWSSMSLSRVGRGQSVHCLYPRGLSVPFSCGLGRDRSVISPKPSPIR